MGHRQTGKGEPKHWPSGVVYLRSHIYSTSLPVLKISALIVAASSSPSDLPCFNVQAPYTNVKIKLVGDPAHPAHGQRALHANQHLLPDSLILPYFGLVHDQSERDPASDYDLSLDRDMDIGVDAAVMGNEARFINDYRGVSTSPNAEFRDMLVKVGNQTEKCIGVFVLSAGRSQKRRDGIRRGEEILVSYGKGFWADRSARPESTLLQSTL